MELLKHAAGNPTETRDRRKTQEGAAESRKALKEERGE